MTTPATSGAPPTPGAPAPSEGLSWVELQYLEENERNPRRISESRLADLKHSISSNPALLEARPIVIDLERGDVPCGNMRLRAVRSLLEDGDEAITAYVVEHDGRIPAFYKRFRDENERREWIVLDNEGFGEWVPPELAALVAEHQAAGGDLRALGMPEPEIAGLLAMASEPVAAEGHGDPARTPEPPEDARTQPGDIWELGRHRLICADAGDSATYARLLEGPRRRRRAADVVWTDPPYGVDYDHERLYLPPEKRPREPLGTMEGDARQNIEAYAVWLEHVVKTAVEHLKPGGPVYLCHADKMVEAAARGFRKAGLHLSAQLIWLKTNAVMSRGDHNYRHEPILYGWRGGAPHVWHGGGTATTVFEVASESGEFVHPTQKPYELVRPHIENSSEPGGIVLDPFAGSGTVLVACEAAARTAACAELDPRWCDVIVQRWQELTGQEAQLVERPSE